MIFGFNFLAAQASDDFVTTWKTDNPGSSNNTSIAIPTNGGGYSYDVDWNNDGIFDQLGITGNVTHNFGVAGTYTIRIRGDFPRIYFNYSGDAIKLLDVNQWGTIAWTSMERAFSGCDNLNITSTDLPDLSAVTNMAEMFAACNALNGPGNIGDWNTSAVTNMNDMFRFAVSFNQPIGNWNTASVTTMLEMFVFANAFNQPISDWNTAAVSNMFAMFYNASSFNQPIGDWNTAAVTNMGNMFTSATSFNQPIGNWNTAAVTNMHGMFAQAGSFNQPIGNWNTAAVTDMSEMFDHATSFNQPVGDWNTAAVTNMSLMFYNASSFNQPIGDWNTAAVTNMFAMFYNASSFNQPIGDWNTTAVTNMSGMFYNASSFNQPVGDWNTAAVTSMSSMFNNASSFNQPIGNWTLNASVSINNMLNNCGMDCTNYTATLNGWAKNPATPSGRSLGAAGRQYGTNAVPARFNLTSARSWTITGDANSGGLCGPAPQPDEFIITVKTDNQGTSGNTSFMIPTTGGGYNYEVDWDYDGVYDQSGITGNVTHDYGTAGTYTIRIRGDFPRIYFDYYWDYGKLLDVNQWGNIAWTSMERAFSGCSNLNITATDLPDLSAVTNMAEMFASCNALNGPSNIGDWNTESVTTMAYMFADASSFNQPIGDWNTSSLTDMKFMFYFANSFNQPIDNWNTSLVTNMMGVFIYNSSFNQPLDHWNTSSVITMSTMFYQASSFNQAIGDWDLNASVNLNDMLSYCGMDCTNYTATLNGWAQNPATPSGRKLGAGGRQYGTNAVPARFNLTSARSWTITGDANSGGLCGPAPQPDEFIITIKTNNPGSSGNTSFTIPTTGGGYNYEVDWDYDGVYDQSGITGNVTHNFGVPGTYTIRIRGDFPRIYFNYGGDCNKLLDVNQWGTIAWTSMERAFSYCVNLNITATDVPNLSAVTNMGEMFAACFALNGPSNIGSWNTSSVQFMDNMFASAGSFNQPIGEWNTAAVTNMEGMFFQAGSFNQPIGNWNTAAVQTMYLMFHNAFSFNQPIGNWSLNASVNMKGMLEYCGMDCTNYGASLLGWANNPATPQGRWLEAFLVKYSAEGVSARNTLITDKGWFILDGGTCSQVPVAHCQSVSVSADANCQASVTAQDVDNGSYDPEGAPLGYALSPEGPFNTGNTVVTLTVTDNYGFTGACTATITVTDNTPPVLTCHDNTVYLDNTGQFVLYNALFEVEVTDNCEVASGGGVSPNTVTCAQAGQVIEVSVFRFDVNGNVGYCTANVTVVDAEAPTVLCPANIEVSNEEGQCSTVVEFPVGVSDNCAVISVNQASGLTTGSAFPVGVTTNTFVISDASGNTASCSFTVTVNDTEAPTISCPADASLGNQSGLCSANLEYSITSSDNCSEATLEQTEGLASASAFPVGITTNTFVITDAGGNTASCSFTVTVSDTEAPTIFCPADASIENQTGLCSANFEYSITSSDNCSEATLAQTEGLASASAFPVGVTTNTFVITDASGNTASCSFTVTVSDTEAPVVTAELAFIDCINQTDGDIYEVNWTVSDNCDTEPDELAVIALPVMSNPTLIFKKKNKKGLKFKLASNEITVEAPGNMGAQVWWAQIQADGGVAVTQAQQIELLANNGSDNIQYNFSNGGVLEQIKNDSLTLVVSATDDAGNVGSHAVETYLQCTAASRNGTAPEHAGDTNPVGAGAEALSAYPNPFTDRLSIRYELGSASPVSLEVYDLTGRRIASLVRAAQAVGAYEASWDARSASAQPAGIYLLRLTTDAGVLTRKVQLVW